MSQGVTFGGWLKRARRELDLSQRDLAQQVGCALVTVQKIEEGRRRPSRQMAELLGRWLKIPLEDMDRFLKLARAPNVARQAAPPVTPGFALTEHDAPVLAAVCRQLGGLPTAIEPAAAGLYQQAPDELARAILPAGIALSAHRALPGGNSPAWLQDGPRDFNSRHRSVADAISRSYNLLSPPGRHVYRSLGVFRGGFTEAAAAAVAGFDGPGASGRVGESVRELGLHNLLQPQSNGTEPRFAAFEAIRADARERCRQAGELDAVRERHAAWFMQRMVQIDWHGDGLAAGLAHARADADNLWAALEWLIGRGDQSRALTLCIALRQFWEYEGYRRDGQAG